MNSGKVELPILIAIPMMRMYWIKTDEFYVHFMSNIYCQQIYSHTDENILLQNDYTKCVSRSQRLIFQVCLRPMKLWTTGVDLAIMFQGSSFSMCSHKQSFLWPWVWFQTLFYLFCLVEGINSFTIQLFNQILSAMQIIHPWLNMHCSYSICNTVWLITYFDKVLQIVLMYRMVASMTIWDVVGMCHCYLKSYIASKTQKLIEGVIHKPIREKNSCDKLYMIY